MPDSKQQQGGFKDTAWKYEEEQTHPLHFVFLGSRGSCCQEMHLVPATNRLDTPLRTDGGLAAAACKHCHPRRQQASRDVSQGFDGLRQASTRFSMALLQLRLVLILRRAVSRRQPEQHGSSETGETARLTIA